MLMNRITFFFACAASAAIISSASASYRLFGIHGNQLVEINLSDGHTTFLMSLPFSAGEGVGFDYNPVDQSLYAGNSDLYKLDLINCEATLAIETRIIK